jgi:hypothetical protein
VRSTTRKKGHIDIDEISVRFIGISAHGDVEYEMGIKR